MTDKTGGLAFPVLHTIDGNWVKDPRKEFSGMTLRDYFAAQIMCGMWANKDVQGSKDELAKGAYACADAMLAERYK